MLSPGIKEFGQEHHFRLYSVADLPERGRERAARIKIAVRRVSYVDDYSGEEYPGALATICATSSPATASPCPALTAWPSRCPRRSTPT